MSLLQVALTALLDRKLAQPHALALPAPAEPNLTKGLLAGLIAGLAGAAAQSLVEKIYPPTLTSAAPPPHWAIGAATGAAYGTLAEYFPVATSRDGINFGMTMLALTHDDVPAANNLRTQSAEIASHIAFGLATEATRRIIRNLL